MLRLFLLFVLLALLAGLAAGGYWVAEEFFWKPQRELVVEEEQANQPAAPDPSIAAWEEISTGLPQSPAPAALGLLREFLTTYPGNPVEEQARAALNLASRQILFTNQSPEGKGTYTVEKGDSMARISSRSKINADWILKVNNLLSHDLQVGQTLLLPGLEVRLVLRPDDGTLEVWESGNEEQPGGLLLTYPVVFSGIPAPGPTQTAVRERFAALNGNRVAFGSPGYASADRTIALEQAGLSLEGIPQAGSNPADPSEQAALPSGILLQAPDLQEVFLLVKKGTPVAIETTQP